MSNLPNFTAYGYQAIAQLNQNFQGGRITYLAKKIATQEKVIIKQFCLATSSDWNIYKEIEREIDILQSLNHSGIPKYLAQFNSTDGLCLVQEYKQAKPLSKSRSFTPKEIKNIALQVLEILVYLQERIPPIIHRDIKPENVLLDEKMKVHLIDFGLARNDSKTMAVSTIIGGTLGFMPPEQFYNQKPTKASDLYSLGATLICLITQTKSINIGDLVDFSTGKIVFKKKASQYSFNFTHWLEKMVEPNPNNRYQNAMEALTALKSFNDLYVSESSKVKLTKLEITMLSKVTFGTIGGLIAGICVAASTKNGFTATEQITISLYCGLLACTVMSSFVVQRIADLISMLTKFFRKGKFDKIID